MMKFYKIPLNFFYFYLYISFIYIISNLHRNIYLYIINKLIYIYIFSQAQYCFFIYKVVVEI